MKKTFSECVKGIVYLFTSPLSAFIISLLVYSLLSRIRYASIFDLSPYPYFNFLADAFIHGQFNFRLEPPSFHDLIVLNDKIFAYWPPFPAILLLPFVVVFGVGFSDIFFTILFGSINVALFVILLKELNKKNIVSLDRIKLGILVLFFAFGTVYITVVPLGKVWFTSHVISVFCVLLLYISSVKYEGVKAFIFTGIAISAAFATRMHLLLLGIWPAWYLLLKNWHKSPKKIMSLIILGLVPPLVTGLLIFYYNYVRFGNIFDLGYAYHNMSYFFREDYIKYGGFNLHYIPTNIYYQYMAYPFLLKNKENIFMGGSLFLLSPLFFGIFWAFKDKGKKASNLFLLLTIFLTNIPILLLMGTGWVQFGPRYTLDFIIPLLILTAIGIKHWKNITVFMLTIISIFHFLVGMYLLILYFGMMEAI